MVSFWVYILYYNGIDETRHASFDDSRKERNVKFDLEITQPEIIGWNEVLKRSLTPTDYTQVKFVLRQNEAHTDISKLRDPSEGNIPRNVVT